MEKTWNRKVIMAIMAIVIVLIVGGGLYFFFTQYNVTNVLVDGNEHYSQEEIEAMILGEGRIHNSVLLSLQYRKKQIKDVPFVESMDVEILSKHEIAVHVYEKKLAGCISYLDKYVYFDREGIVVEISDALTEGVPQIRGLSFDHVIMHEALPVDDKAIFGDILKVSQLLGKYELKADKLFFSKTGEITLVFDKAKVLLGTEENIDIKVEQLSLILPEIIDKAGTLHLENYDENTQRVNFQLD